VHRSRADDGADCQSADHAGSNGATAAMCFRRLWGGHNREPKGRGGRESSEGSCHLSHGAPSFGSLRAYPINDRPLRFLRIFAQHQQSSWMRGSSFSREWLVNKPFGIDPIACPRGLNFCNACGEIEALPPNKVGLTRQATEDAL
jgi:hypothetical protein